MKNTTKLLSLISAGLAIASLPAGAVTVTVFSSDTPGCDVLIVPTIVDELGDPVSGAGTPPFPPGEQILHSVVNTIELTVCLSMPSNPAMVDAQITITNLQAFSFSQVWFVMDTGGSFSNSDGLVNGTQAMLIDTAGVNKPLLFESGPANGIFDPGESWVFHVQDYVPGTSGLPADSFYSPGMVGAANIDRFTSIIAVVPEPSGLVLSLLGGLAFLRRRRRG
ncbi:MAG: PEP-CTERM sorting domain-containing protein [Verrucomicrobia bacterium]|nr:PEP-CTERM sorting domain-containing protein [Verrucomicrobiota bacterium]